MFAAAISLGRSCGDRLPCLARGQGHLRSVGHRCQKRSWVERRLRPVPALFDHLGRHWPRRPKRAARLCDAHPDQRHPHRLRLGQHRTRPHRPGASLRSPSPTPPPPPQARPPARRLCGQTTRRRRPVPAARRRLCAAGHGGLVQPRLYLGLPPVHPARVGHHHRAHGRPVLPVPAPRRSSRGPGLCPLCPGHCRVLRHHV